VNAPFSRLDPATAPVAFVVSSGVRWVVRSKVLLRSLACPFDHRTHYSTSPQAQLLQLSLRPEHAHRFDTLADASAHATQLSYVYQVPFEVVARGKASNK
jgi:hypothetical protein